MKYLATIVLALGMGATAALAVEGTWKATVDEDDLQRIHLELRYGRTSNMGSMYRTQAFTGLTATQVGSETQTPVQFTLEREAGRVSFEGSFRAGRGSGQFTFEPRSGYLESVRKLGVEVSSREGKDESLLVLALLDVSTDYMKSMIAEGYKVPLDEFQSMCIFDVTPA